LAGAELSLNPSRLAKGGQNWQVFTNCQMARLSGGRDRDRTCDPYHVKEARASEIADFIGINGTKNGGKGRHVPLMFAFSGSLNLGALPKNKKAPPRI
jgi:hypothetical protein